MIVQRFDNKCLSIFASEKVKYLDNMIFFGECALQIEFENSGATVDSLTILSPPYDAHKQSTLLTGTKKMILLTFDERHIVVQSEISVKISRRSLQKFPHYLQPQLSSISSSLFNSKTNTNICVQHICKNMIFQRLYFG